MCYLRWTLAWTLWSPNIPLCINRAQNKWGEIAGCLHAERVTCWSRADLCTLCSQPLKHEPPSQAADKWNTRPTSHWVLLCSSQLLLLRLTVIHVYRCNKICCILGPAKEQIWPELANVFGWRSQCLRQTRLRGFSFVSTFCCCTKTTETKMKPCQWQLVSSTVITETEEERKRSWSLSLVVTYMQRGRSVGESERDEQEGS